MKTLNGWVLTREVVEHLKTIFDGTDDQLVEYVSNNNLGRDMFRNYMQNGDDLLMFRPLYYVGEYEVYPDSNGVIATER